MNFCGGRLVEVALDGLLFDCDYEDHPSDAKEINNEMNNIEVKDDREWSREGTSQMNKH